MTTGEDAAPLAAFTAHLPFGAASARTARGLVIELLADFSPPDRLVEDALLVVHELVVNGVSHGAPDDHQEIEVSCAVFPRELVISVHDQGTAGTLDGHDRSPELTSGRGLLIVSRLSRRWSVDRAAGTRVSAHLPL